MSDQDASSHFTLNTYSYIHGGDLRSMLAGFAEWGFRELELMVYPGHLWPLDMDAGAFSALRTELAGNGLTVHTINQPNIDINVTSPCEAMRRHSLDVIRSNVTLAGELGAQGVVIGPGKANPLFAEAIGQLTGWSHQALDELIPHASACGTRLLMENMPFAFLPGADGMMQSLETHGADGVGVIYDIANAHFIGEDLLAGFKRVAERLHTVHVSDTTRQTYRHDPVGAGDLDFGQALTGAQAAGYRGRAVLEIISRTPRRDIDNSVRRLTAIGWNRLA